MVFVIIGLGKTSIVKDEISTPTTTTTITVTIFRGFAAARMAVEPKNLMLLTKDTFLCMEQNNVVHN